MAGLSEIDALLGGDSPGGTVGDATYRVTANELRSFIERLERMNLEAADISEQKKEINAEAKARGYDTKAMARIITLRKRSKDDIDEEDAVLTMYMEVMGM